MHILVTGSARLDVYNHLGDSLAGRYFRHRLLPLTAAELAKTRQPVSLDKLMQHSGFPEPYIASNDVDVARWRLQYINSMLSTDIFSIEEIRNIKAMHLLFDLLRNRVGSPISYQSLAEDLAVSAKTVKKYIEILQSLYIIFKITPFSNNIARSLLKEPKIYFFDAGLVKGNQGVKLENLTAVSLLKHCYAKEDYLAEKLSLHYIRTKDNREVDFAIAKDDSLISLIEVKLSDNKISDSLKYFQKKYGTPAVQIVKNIRHEYRKDDIEIRDATKFLTALDL